MPDWMIDTLRAYPALIWMFASLGLPWALVALPRRDWQDRALVACLALAFGPALLTAWMFVLGTLGQNHDPDAGRTPNPMQTTIAQHSGGTDLMRMETILAGTLVLALVGAALVWRKSRTAARPEADVPLPDSGPLAWDERLLLGLIVVATVARALMTAWVGFGAYDELWVYGYQGRIYTLLGYIPRDIGYYPQFLPLQYAYLQITIAGDIADHVARAVLPFLHTGSVLAAYVLGSRLFSRRVGILLAALWALYPHFGYWTRVGDLEIPVTFAFTGAAAFFLLAWTTTEGAYFRRRYAIIAGLFLGVAMWTKPTAGAFILGVALLVAVETLRVPPWREWRAWWPRFEVALLTGLACIPLGGMWYARNFIIGHEVIVMPPPVWVTRAMRSGAEFGWPLLALALLLAWLYLGPPRPRPNRGPVLVGALLIAAAVLPSILQPARMGPLEWLLLLAGAAILTLTLGVHAAAYLSRSGRRDLAVIGWAGLLALPYFVTWFRSYSYHYRLSFAIVPLLALPVALILARWFPADRLRGWRPPRLAAHLLLALALGLPGVAITIYDEGAGWGWLWNLPAPDEPSSSALLGVVDTLDAYIETHGPPAIIAPGLQPLPFFFPTLDIDVTSTPRRFYQVNGADLFIDGNLAELAYQDSGDVQPFHNQWIASLRRENVTRLLARYEDPTAHHAIYVIDLERRFEPPPVAHELEQAVVFGDFARLVGYEFNRDSFAGEQPVEIMLLWQVLQPVDADYMIYLHLIAEDAPDRVWANRDGPVNRPWGWTRNYYSTLFWEPGEYVIDRRAFVQQGTPPGEDYRIRVGFYDLETGQRVPVTVDGALDGDGFTLPHAFRVE